MPGLRTTRSGRLASSWCWRGGHRISPWQAQVDSSGCQTPSTAARRSTCLPGSERSCCWVRWCLGSDLHDTAPCQIYKEIHSEPNWRDRFGNWLSLLKRSADSLSNSTKLRPRFPLVSDSELVIVLHISSLVPLSNWIGLIVSSFQLRFSIFVCAEIGWRKFDALLRLDWCFGNENSNRKPWYVLVQNPRRYLLSEQVCHSWRFLNQLSSHATSYRPWRLPSWVTVLAHRMAESAPKSRKTTASSSSLLDN